MDPLNPVYCHADCPLFRAERTYHDITYGRCTAHHGVEKVTFPHGGSACHLSDEVRAMLPVGIKGTQHTL